ncbi:MAG: hypothetical protein F4149_03835 [Gammaproteobacteria bacterium]|nr:hypothetical protein [Gammaproteobacteria bacterium]MYK84275.1 hypothetical protein [Gammaproteobacteria bacterium]
MSLFGRLFRYRATEGKSPREDFLTEALAGLLENSLLLRVAFVKRFVDCDVETVSVETQKSAGSYGRLDLWLEVRECSGDRHVVVFENKIGAPEGDGQLQSYERYLREHHKQAKSRTLIYLTPYTPSDFQPDEKLVVFRNLWWYQVFDWMKGWAQEPGAEAGPVALVKELLALMEEWDLTNELNASDLAAAVAYRNRGVEQRMTSILREVEDTCKVKGKWGHYDRGAYSQSSWTDDDEHTYLEFGYEFSREDENWSVSSLHLPSAFFAVKGDGVEQLSGLSSDSGWNDPPESWSRGDQAKVKRMDSLEIGGKSLHLAYLAFFKTALEEAEKALRIG